MNDHKCKECDKCINMFGRTRCGHCRGGYIYISENDPACEEFDLYDPEESET